MKGMKKHRGGRHRRSHYTTTTTPMTPPMTYDPNGSEVTTEELHISPVPRHRNSVVPAKYFSAARNSNRHHFAYKINNPNICAEHHRVFLLIAILTAPGNVDRRMAIRDTWGASYNLPNYAMPVIFLLGDTSDFTAQTDIHSENKIYSDIVQESFVDSQSNLTLKTVMAYKWARTFCPRADFVLVTTDSVLVDTFKLAPYLLTHRPHVDTHFILCHLVHCCQPVPEHDPALPPFTQDTPATAQPQYAGRAFPTHCSGHAYVLPSTVINQMYVMSLDTPLFTPYQAYVGVLAEKLGLFFHNTRHSFAGFPGQNQSVAALFNSTVYLDSPLIVGVLSHQYPRTVAKTLRQLWLSVLAHHKSRPKLDVKQYMKLPEESDHHIYFVALVALSIDILVLGTIGYLIFCRRRYYKSNGHSNHR